METYKDQLASLFDKGRQVKFGKGEIILRAGDTPPGVFYLKTGLVKVYSLTDKGEENLHVLYGVGEIFPLIWAFKGVIRDVFYEAVEPTTLMILTKGDFMSEIKSSAELSFAVAGQVVDQFFIYADRIDNLEYNNAYDRVIYRLLFLASRFGKRRGSEVIIDVPLTHQQIASSINLARETASREIERLEQKRLITRSRNRIIILNLSGLSAELRDSVDLEPWGVK